MLTHFSSGLVKSNKIGFAFRAFAEAASQAATSSSSSNAQDNKIFEKLTQPPPEIQPKVEQPTEKPPEEPPKPSVEQLENEIKDLKNQNLYLLADVENSRRRFERLAKELENTAITAMAKQLLPVADNIRRILDSGEKQTVKAIFEAVGIVDTELHNIFKTFKIERLNSKGIKFNPEFHDAIATIPGKTEESGVVIDVITEGYTLADKLLRAAKVVVGK